MQLAADQRGNRADLVTERVRQGKVLADLQVEASVAGGLAIASTNGVHHPTAKQRCSGYP